MRLETLKQDILQAFMVLTHHTELIENETIILVQNIAEAGMGFKCCGVGHSLDLSWGLYAYELRPEWGDNMNGRRIDPPNIQAHNYLFLFDHSACMYACMYGMCAYAANVWKIMHNMAFIIYSSMDYHGARKCVMISSSRGAFLSNATG